MRSLFSFSPLYSTLSWKSAPVYTFRCECGVCVLLLWATGVGEDPSSPIPGRATHSTFTNVPTATLPKKQSLLSSHSLVPFIFVLQWSSSASCSKKSGKLLFSPLNASHLPFHLTFLLLTKAIIFIMFIIFIVFIIFITPIVDRLVQLFTCFMWLHWSCIA